MTRLLIIFALFISNSTIALADGRCVPFFRNYSAQEYKAHNRNFDIACDNFGNIFVANFEGLLYYNGATWNKIHTPGISRVTRVARDKNGRIWVGGYNIFGYLVTDKQGRLKLQTIVSDTDKIGIGEVDLIAIKDKEILVHTTHNTTYRLEGKKLRRINITQKTINNTQDSISHLKLPSGCEITYSRTNGLSFSLIATKWGSSEWAALSENDGLISNTVNYLTYDHNHCVWGATDKGIFVIEAMSPYGRISEKQDLKGEVNCVNDLDGKLYIGTMEGLFTINGTKVTRLIKEDAVCWQFDNYDDEKIICATTGGTYCITKTEIKRINSNTTFSVCMGHGTQEFYAGETDGIYHCNLSGNHKLVANIEKVTKLSIDHDNLIAETIFGQLWQISLTTGQKKCLRDKADPNSPKVKTTDCFGTVWQTDGDGRNLSLMTHSNYANKLLPWINPFRNLNINALHINKDGNICIGGDYGVILLDSKQLQNINQKEELRPYIREVRALGDSIIWGGFGPGMKPTTEVTDITLPANCKRVVVAFSTKERSFVQPTLYRYRIDNGRWTAWDEDNEVEFNNMSSGETSIEIQAQDLFGRVSDSSFVKWKIEYPFYMRWYAWTLYTLCLFGIIWQFLRWRTRKLNRDNEKLESLVSERTSELSEALYDLKKTQKKLVQMERTATAGKLTQGLIDRILNPINYINNFSRLTSGLAKDLKEDIEDEKDNMSEDNYEDCEDILGMMTQNLQKIEEHGTNTTRTLRAMEAMLNNQIGTRSDHDILPLCHQAIEMTKRYHSKEIKDCGINISIEAGNTPIVVNIDQDAISKVLLSLLTNSVYAVAKKYNQSPYKPEIKLTVNPTQDDNEHKAIITIHDNGVGIEDSIKEKIFDPFFTTKTTGEATGVGLYLVRELIQDHNGTITLNSQQGEFCQLTIII